MRSLAACLLALALVGCAESDPPVAASAGPLEPITAPTRALKPAAMHTHFVAVHRGVPGYYRIADGGLDRVFGDPAQPSNAAHPAKEFDPAAVVFERHLGECADEIRIGHLDDRRETVLAGPDDTGTPRRPTGPAGRYLLYIRSACATGSDAVVMRDISDQSEMRWAAPARDIPEVLDVGADDLGVAVVAVVRYPSRPAELVRLVRTGAKLGSPGLLWTPTTPCELSNPAFRPDGALIVGCDSKANLVTREGIATELFDVGPGEPIDQVSVDPSGLHVLVGRRGGGVLRWSASEGVVGVAPALEHPSWVPGPLTFPPP